MIILITSPNLCDKIIMCFNLSVTIISVLVWMRESIECKQKWYYNSTLTNFPKKKTKTRKFTNLRNNDKDERSKNNVKVL